MQQSFLDRAATGVCDVMNNDEGGFVYTFGDGFDFGNLQPGYYAKQDVLLCFRQTSPPL